MLKSMCTIIKAGGNKHTPYRHQSLRDADPSTDDESQMRIKDRVWGEMRAMTKHYARQPPTQIATFNK
jgi:hypothetical protein